MREAAVVAMLGAGLAGCGTGPGLDGTGTGADAPAPPQAHVDRADRAAAPVATAVAAGTAARALVLLDAASLAGGSSSTQSLGAPDLARRELLFADAKRLVFQGAPAGLTVDTDYPHLPIALVTVATPEALAYLTADPRVLRVAADDAEEAFLAESLPLIRQPQAFADGKDGTGTAVAVLDTGADYRVADLGSCTAPGTPASCRVAFAQDFAPSDGLLDAAEHHGTNVSSIIARVAPGTKILALDVFNGTAGYDSDIISAINWVIANKDTYHTVAMNLSLGGGAYTSPCPSTALAVAIQEARTAGILPAVATGNSAYTNALSSPACGPAAIAVGAVYDSNVGGLGTASCSDPTTAADQVTCFSNAASFMTMLAPGAFITAGGYTMAGTSQATPHVAGAVAVLRGAFPGETVDETVARLVNSGVPITDKRNGLVMPRLDLAAAAAGCVFKATPSPLAVSGDAGASQVALTTSSSCGWSVTSDAAWLTVTSSASGTGPGTIAVHVDANTGGARSGALHVTGDAGAITVAVNQAVDTAPPTGTITLAGGAAYTRVKALPVAITGSDPSGVATMCLSNTTACTTFVAFAASTTWTIAGTQGVNTVRLWLRDARGNTTVSPSTISDTIIYDTTVPTSGAVTATPGDGAVTLGWAAGTDATSGVDHYVVTFATGTVAPASCAVGTVIYTGADRAFVHQGLSNGTSYAYRVCAVDGAGNVGAGATASTSPRPESDPPVGTVAINGGATYTKTTAVTLALTATDASTVTQVCLSSTTTCTAWVAFAASKAFTLPATQGTRTVYAWFKDQWGNASTTPATASIVLDSVAPTGATLTATFGDGADTLAWTAATDATSGVDHYVLVYAAAATPPASCAVGTQLASGTDRTFTHTGLTNGTTYAYRVCAVDRAGNTSAGTTATAAPRPEADPPVGTVTINGGATYTKSTAVTLALTATDASAVTQVCLASSTTCTAWVAFAASKAFTLPATQGTRTVYAWFKDQWGNASTTPATASIVLDTVAPTTSTLTRTAGSRQVSLAWTAATDATSGLDGYRLVYLPGTTLPAAQCATGTELYAGGDLAFVHTGLTAGATYAYRLCARDRAGNVTTGVAGTAVAAP